MRFPHWFAKLLGVEKDTEFLPLGAYTRGPLNPDANEDRWIEKLINRKVVVRNEKF